MRVAPFALDRALGLAFAFGRAMALRLVLPLDRRATALAAALRVADLAFFFLRFARTAIVALPVMDSECRVKGMELYDGALPVRASMPAVECALHSSPPQSKFQNVHLHQASDVQSIQRDENPRMQTEADERPDSAERRCRSRPTAR